MKTLKITIFIAVILGIFFLSSCDKRVIKIPDYQINSLFYSPDYIYADQNSNTYATITANVVDEKGYAAQDVEVMFTTTLGTITSSVNTDENGMAQAKLFDTGIAGTAIVTAKAGKNSKQSITIEIKPEATYHIQSIVAEPDTIYADNNLTYSEISVVVKDQAGFAVTNEPIHFKASIGRILNSVNTDSSGVAKTTFWDDGAQGVSHITAYVSDDSASVDITIEPQPELQSLVLNLISNDFNIDDVTTIRAIAENTVGFVPDGTKIRFQTDLGFFVSDAGDYLGDNVTVETENGKAQISFNAGTHRGTATISAILDTLTATEQVTIHPGTPMYMYLTPSTSEIEANSSESVTIDAQVQDKYHNPIEAGKLIVFTTDLGTILPENANTDSLGIGTTVFSPGVQAGTATITAKADSAQATTIINVISNDVAYIQFENSAQINLQVQGTGGQESVELRINLYDMSGNLSDNTQMVYFELLDPPAGTTINNVGVIDSTESVNGQAIVSINSGMESGIVRVKAYTYNQAGNEISAIKSNIVVNAGPPTHVNFNIGGPDSGVNMGDGQWKVQVSALITDQYGNPVSDGTAVFFSLPDNPEFATIEASAYIGNYNADGDSLSGTAFTNIIYAGVHTNDIVNVELDVGGNVTFSGQLTLPIQQAWLDIIVVPQTISWDEQHPNNPPSTQIAEVRLICRDGQNNLINKQEITFTTDKGEFQDAGSDNDNDPSTELTGLPNFSPGRINKNIVVHRYECPPPSSSGPGETDVKIRAKILGLDVEARCELHLIRYAEMGKGK